MRRRLEHLLATGAVYCDVDVDARILGYRGQAILWLTVAPAKLAAVAAALAEHPEIAWAAATTGTTNLAASAVCHDVDALYEYLTGRVGILDGVQQVETAPVIRVIKRAGRSSRLVPVNLGFRWRARVLADQHDADRTRTGRSVKSPVSVTVPHGPRSSRGRPEVVHRCADELVREVAMTPFPCVMRACGTRPTPRSSRRQSRRTG